MRYAQFSLSAKKGCLGSSPAAVKAASALISPGLVIGALFVEVGKPPNENLGLILKKSFGVWPTGWPSCILNYALNGQQFSQRRLVENWRQFT